MFGTTCSLHLGSFFLRKIELRTEFSYNASMTQIEDIANGAQQIVANIMQNEDSYTEVVEVLERSGLVIGLDVFSVLIAAVIGYIGVIVMTYGCFKGVWDFSLSIGKHTTHRHLPMIRIELGKHLALGLEFLVGKDIVESIVHPTWNDLGKLGAIIALRTVVTVFLSRELKEVEEELKVEGQELALEERRSKLARQQKSA